MIDTDKYENMSRWELWYLEKYGKEYQGCPDQGVPDTPACVKGNGCECWDWTERYCESCDDPLPVDEHGNPYGDYGIDCCGVCCDECIAYAFSCDGGLHGLITEPEEIKAWNENMKYMWNDSEKTTGSYNNWDFICHKHAKELFPKAWEEHYGWRGGTQGDFEWDEERQRQVKE